ncbi:MAG TPA: glycosyltransferase [Pirellulales bacterium]|nr:glycosyltransferase [Pirellulales bacterium]
MKLLALTEGPDHVCYRYRVAPFARALARAGWQIECRPLAKGPLARWRQLRRAGCADAVLLQRKLLPWWQLRVLRRSAKTLIYDFDDALFHRDSYHPKGIDSWQRMLGFWMTVYAADLVLAGNPFLFDQAAEFVGAERVRLLPTCVEPQKYPLARHADDETLKLVWIGQRSTVRCLYQMHQQLRAASVCEASRGGAELRVVSDVFVDLDGVRVVPVAWSAATETSELAAADIGISWLPDDRWSRGKCGLKVLQYMAAGLPVIANRVGVHREMIVEGVTGFLADTPQEWAEAVGRLSSDTSLRAAMGAAARKRVEEEYSVARWEEPFAAAIDEVAPHPSGTSAERRQAFESQTEARPVRRKRSALARLSCLWAFAVCFLAGCTGFGTRPGELPLKNTLVLEPLIVHSDFTLPPRHRLLEELVQERTELLSKLQLPKSEEPVNIYLFESEERFREFIERDYPEFPQRRAFFVETDTRLAVYAQWGDHIAEDLRHEVAHGYLHSVVPNLPLWLDEGLAEYAEVPRGHAGVNRPHLRLLLEKLASFGWKPDLARLERLTSVSEMTQLDYAEAWAWVHWLMETDPARRQILRGYVEELRTAGVVPPFSVRLHGWFPQPDPLLVAHLRALAGSAR